MNFQATLDRIQSDAAQLQPARVALTVVAAPLFVVGWLAGKAWSVVWVVASWLLAAAAVGWSSARGGS